MAVEQTKGYLKLKGKIWSLNNKDAKEFGDSKRLLSFGLQTSKDNSLFLQVGDWKNTPLNVKIKGEGMTAVEEVNEQAAIDRIKEIFKDGDSVFVNLRADVDTYRKKLNFLVNQIYIEKEPINFDAADFEETNELNQFVVITEKAENKEVKVGVTTFKEEMIEETLKLSDPDINAYFIENAKVGDLMKLSISVNRKPIYGEVSEEEPARKTLKGKSVGGSTKRKIEGYTESLEVTDVDLEKVEKKKYTSSDIRESLDKVTVTKENAPKKETTKENKPTASTSNDDLPY